jgi:L-arabinose isomerase
MSVKHGPVTLLSVAESDAGKLKLVYAQGESVEGSILEIGNTNSRYKFSIGARKFVETWNKSGLAHHCAVGLGHIGSKLEKLAQLLNMEILQIC